MKITSDLINLTRFSKDFQNITDFTIEARIIYQIKTINLQTDKRKKAIEDFKRSILEGQINRNHKSTNGNK